MRTYLFGFLLFICGSVFAEEYVLAVSWQPEYCHYRIHSQACQSINAEQFVATNLALHGLWPKSASYCQVDGDKKVKKGGWADLPAVVLTPETKQSLAEVMPGIAGGIDRHEWAKHGTCSGVSQEAYFKKSVDLTKQIAKSELSSLLRSKIGQQVSLETLQGVANTEFGKNAENGLKFLCNPGNKSEDNTQALFELRFFLQADSVEDVNLKNFISSPINVVPACKDGPIYIRPLETPTAAPAAETTH